MCQDVMLVLGNAALALSSGWALCECSDLQFACIGFGLYLVDGTLGVLENGIPQGSRLKRAHDIASRVARKVYLPLIATEAFLATGLEERYAYIHLVLPDWLLTQRYQKPVRAGLKDVNIMISTASLCYSSYTRKNVCGGVCALLNFTAFMITKKKSMGFLLLMSIANLVAAQLFKNSLIK